MEERRRKRSPKGPEPQTRQELIVARWKSLGRPALGARELSAIQAHLQKQFGKGAVQSPAGIARVLADEGAELRHPEVIECDALWRAERLRNGTPQLAEIDSLVQGEALTLKQAEELIKKLEEKRTQSDPADLQSLRAIAIEARDTAQRNARKKSLDSIRRAEQQEIAEWLGIWIKTPKLFADWLELRRRSGEFRKMFSGESKS